jgi:hypothetical protein
VNTADNNNGTYKLSYTPTKIGDYKFTVAVGPTPIGGHTNPFPLHVIPAAAKGANSLAYGPGLTHGTVGGDNNKFTVETRDAFDNKLTKGGAKVAGQLVNDATGESVPVSVKDNGDGTYACEYAGVGKAGNYTLTPTVNGEPVKDAPFKVQVAAGGFDPNNTEVVIPKPGFAGRKGPKVTVKDRQGNPRAGFDDDVEADLTPKFKIPKVKGKSNGDGTYDIDYPPNLLPGDYDIDVRVNGQGNGKGPYTGAVQHNAVTAEHKAQLQAKVGKDAPLFERLLLGATDAERVQFLAALK